VLPGLALNYTTGMGLANSKSSGNSRNVWSDFSIVGFFNVLNKCLRVFIATSLLAFSMIAVASNFSSDTFTAFTNHVPHVVNLRAKE